MDLEKEKFLNLAKEKKAPSRSHLSYSSQLLIRGRNRQRRMRKWKII